MSTTASGTLVHPILGCVGEVSAALVKVAKTAPAFMTASEKKTALQGLAVTEARLVELRLRVLAAAHADGIGDDTGASSTAAYVAHATRQTREAAASDVRFAASLDRDYEQSRRALAAGVVNVAQARVILWALSQLSDRVTLEEKQRSERHMIEQAQMFDANHLRVIGRRLYEVIDPDQADVREGEELERQERRARAKAAFSFCSNGDGTCQGSFKTPDLHAAILKKALQALTAPRRIGEARFDERGKKLPYSTVLGLGFMELLEHLPVDKLPNAGGMAATIVVTLDHQTLLSGIGAAALDDGTRISASEARRLACEAGIIPLVLGGESQPLDIGRKRRLHDVYQRIVLAHRDGGCLAENCDRPPAWCESHHEVWWEQGGVTSVANGGLRCGHHHRLEHDPGYTKARLPNGQMRYRRRQ